MKLNIGDYSVTISAKHQHMDGAATMPFLCELSLALAYASECLENKGCNATARHYRRLRKSVYDALDSRGYYDDVRA